MAKPKTGYILRSDIRRVECPKCGAQPGAFCDTFDKREHQERASVAIATPAPTLDEAVAGEARSQSQPVSVSATPPVTAVEPHAIDGTDGSGGGSPRERRENDDDDGAEFAETIEKLREEPRRVRVDWHRGTQVTTWYGTGPVITRRLVRFMAAVDFGDIPAAFPVTTPVTILAGANDSILITDL